MPTSRLATAIKALRQLGFTQVALNALYKFGLASGHYQRVIIPPAPVHSLHLTPILPIPASEQVRQTLGQAGLNALLAEADEIVAGKFRQFGAEPIPLVLALEGPLAHWTAYETGKVDLHSITSDIKLIWEPARFGWAFVLGRAYHVSQDERYAAAFWRLFEAFNAANPAYLGPNWTSGQEVGLRLMAWVWAGQILLGSEYSSPERLAKLAAVVAAHAARIPATLLYARSQNNNHLLSEAAALYTAGLALPAHPDSQRWRSTGRDWLTWCFSHQVDASGEYVQHSTNYHRLMLQLALWVNAIANNAPVQDIEHEKLALATRWLLSRLDPQTGHVPNLGANDGALIFPLSTCEFGDYRPVAQAAAQAFLSSRLPSGTWDEMSLWFGLQQTHGTVLERPESSGLLYAKNSWGTLRAVQYTSRPSHADQLHCDLWWRGLNIAQDAGTYRYNADPPWDNQLASTLVHNTLSVNAEEQMTRAGRFLYLDWAWADFNQPLETSGAARCVSAWTSAYARLGVRHERAIAVFDDERWLMEDNLTHTPFPGLGKIAPTYRLHWLLPDWDWELENPDTHPALWLKSPHGWISLTISANQPLKRIGLLRAGELVYGQGLASPVFGWVSPTYNVKKPALSLSVEVQSAQNVSFSSEFIFPMPE
jgi:hypothetical protein